MEDALMERKIDIRNEEKEMQCFPLFPHLT